MPETLFRVTAHLENLEKSGNSKVVREKLGKMEKSGKCQFNSKIRKGQKKKGNNR